MTFRTFKDSNKTRFLKAKNEPKKRKGSTFSGSDLRLLDQNHCKTETN
uniref:Uncharacterized protein n=1 Tax=Rhizophora mucronata TaxID=61149 RepID=A0A2P2MLZ8_RHIMU